MVSLHRWMLLEGVFDARSPRASIVQGLHGSARAPAKTTVLSLWLWTRVRSTAVWYSYGVRAPVGARLPVLYTAARRWSAGCAGAAGPPAAAAPGGAGHHGGGHAGPLVSRRPPSPFRPSSGTGAGVRQTPGLVVQCGGAGGAAPRTLRWCAMGAPWFERVNSWPSRVYLAGPFRSGSIRMQLSVDGCPAAAAAGSGRLSLQTPAP